MTNLYVFFRDPRYYYATIIIRRRAVSFLSFFQILLEIRVKYAQAPCIFVCVLVYVAHLQHADILGVNLAPSVMSTPDLPASFG